MSQNNVPFPLRILIEENGVTDQFDFYQIDDLSPKEAFRLGSNLLVSYLASAAEPSDNVPLISRS